jgi:hypothetical protein
MTDRFDNNQNDIVTNEDVCATNASLLSMLYKPLSHAKLVRAISSENATPTRADNKQARRLHFY